MRLTRLPKNSFILDQLPYINKLESNSNGLTAHPTAPIQCPPTINPLSAELSSNILDSKFNNNILDTLVPDLVPNLNELELLSCKVQH